MQATAQVRRRLAELELDMDRQQGWVRGGTKSEVSLPAARSMRHSLHLTPMTWATARNTPKRIDAVLAAQRTCALASWSQWRYLLCTVIGTSASPCRHVAFLRQGAG